MAQLTPDGEISPRVLEAGIDALRRYDRDYESLESAVRRIWEAMREAAQPAALYDDD